MKGTLTVGSNSGSGEGGAELLFQVGNGLVVWVGSLSEFNSK